MVKYGSYLGEKASTWHDFEKRQIGTFLQSGSDTKSMQTLRRAPNENKCYLIFRVNFVFPGHRCWYRLLEITPFELLTIGVHCPCLRFHSSITQALFKNTSRGSVLPESYAIYCRYNRVLFSNNLKSSLALLFSRFISKIVKSLLVHVIPRSQLKEPIFQ